MSTVILGLPVATPAYQETVGVRGYNN